METDDSQENIVSDLNEKPTLQTPSTTIQSIEDFKKGMLIKATFKVSQTTVMKC